jgi:hypothetical protein
MRFTAYLPILSVAIRIYQVRSGSIGVPKVVVACTSYPRTGAGSEMRVWGGIVDFEMSRDLVLSRIPLWHRNSRYLLTHTRVVEIWVDGGRTRSCRLN